MLKTKQSVLALLSLCLASFQASADPKNPLGGLTGTIGMQSGDYSFVHYDKGLLQKTYLDEIVKRSQADRDYFQQVVTTLENQLITLAQTTIFNPKNGLKTLSDRSNTASQPTPATDFLEALNNFHMARLELETKINGLTAIAKAFPSQQVQADKSGLSKIPAYGSIDFAPLKTFYENKLSEMVTFASNLPHVILLNNGAPHLINAGSGEGLALNAPGFQLSQKQVEEYRARIQKLRRWPVSSTENIDQYTVYLKQLLQRFINTYGTTEKYRFHNTASEKAKKEAAEDIAEAFWTRSYLRAVYSMPIGGIGIKYKKRMANIDFLTASKDIFQFVEEPVWDQKEVVETEQSYRLALEVAEARSSSVLDGNVSILSRANALINLLAGNAQLADCLKAMLKLLAADFYEHKLSLKGNGAELLMKQYKNRYLVDKSGKVDATAQNYYTGLIKAYDPQALDENASNGSMGMNSETSAYGQFVNVLTLAKNKENELGLAYNLELQVNNATRMLSGEVTKKRRSRLNDLIGPQ